ncbi:hypothetical protein T492DRAFT_869253, partial [Pavlovales sp. CCMP2436]
ERNSRAVRAAAADAVAALTGGAYASVAEAEAMADSALAHAVEAQRVASAVLARAAGRNGSIVGNGYAEAPLSPLASNFTSWPRWRVLAPGDRRASVAVFRTPRARLAVAAARQLELQRR